MFAVCFLVGSPAPAHAWWHWLDELTGPGPFMGPDFQWRLVCIDDPLPELSEVKLLTERDLARREVDDAQANLRSIQDAANKNKDPKDSRIGEALRHLAEKQSQLKVAQDALREAVNKIRKRSNPGDYVLRSVESFDSDEHGTAKRTLARAAGIGCVIGQGMKNPAASLNFRTAVLWSGPQGDEPGRLDFGGKKPRVHLWQQEISYSVFVDHRKTVELASGLGVYRAYGDGFESFSRFYWKPIIVTITPVPLKRPFENAAKGGTVFWAGLARSFSISSSILYMPKGFSAADFGATGSYKTDRELVGVLGIVVDLSRF
jgi:hypothetical protein